MIPTMIVFGLVLGRWWKSALVAGAIGWPLLLLVTGVFRDPVVFTAGALVSAALLGAANTALGVGLHQAVLWMVRRARS